MNCTIEYIFSSTIFNAIISPDVLLQMNQGLYETDIVGSIIGAAIIGLPFLAAGLILLRKVDPEIVSNRYTHLDEQ